MTEVLHVDLFAEDRAHEEFIKALIKRLAAEAGRQVVLRVISARGGRPRVDDEFASYQKTVLSGGRKIPDLVVVAKDTNCRASAEARENIKIEERLKHRTVIACPDPHVERWYLCEPAAFQRAVGVAPRGSKKKVRARRLQSRAC